MNWWFGFVGYIKRKVHARRTRQQEEDPTDKSARQTAKATVWIAIFTVILAFASAGSLFVINEQLGEMHDSGAQTDRLISLYRSQVNQMSKLSEETHRLAAQAKLQSQTSRDALVEVQRALVSFSGQSSGVQKIRDGKVIGIEIALPWFNGGNTPTKKSLGMVDYDFTPPTGMTDAFDFRDRAVVPPRQFVVAAKGFANATETIPIIDFQSVKSQTIRLYVWGWMTYQDSFRNTPKRLSEFCDEITGVESTKEDMTDPASQIKWNLALCPTHNCSDEECRDYKEKTKSK